MYNCDTNMKERKKDGNVGSSGVAAIATLEATITYCDTVWHRQPSVSRQTGVIDMSHLFMQANAALVETLVDALQGMRHTPTATVCLPRFIGRPESPGDPTIYEWLSDIDVFVRQCGVPEGSEPWC